MGLFKRSRLDSTGTPLWSKWKRRLLAAFLLLVVLPLLSPILIAKTPLRNWLVAVALKQFKGNVRVGGASLGWFRAPVLTDIEVRDRNGRMLLHAPRVEGSKSLAALLYGRFDLGEFRFHKTAVHIVCSHDTTNLEASLAHWLQRKEGPRDSDASPLEGIAVRATFEEASLVLEDEDTGRTWTLDPVEMSLAVPRDRRTPLHVQLSAAVTDARETGRLSADLSAHLAEGREGKPRLRAEGEVHAENAPLAAAEPFLRRFEPQIKLDGRWSANLTLRQGDGQPGSPDVRLEGDVSLQSLTLSDPLLGPDTLKLARVEAPCRLALDGSRLSVEKLDIRTDVGKASLTGTMDLAKDMRDLLHQPGHRLDAELDLARLAALAPNTLHLSKDAQITSGTLTLHLRSSIRGESLLWEGDLRTSDLRGQYQGQHLTWKEPLAVVFTAHQEINGLPVFERFQCDSDFLRVEMSGSVEEWTARGNFNLGRLGEHLAGFVDLGSLRVKGEGSIRLNARRDSRGGYRVQGDVQIAQLNLADGARSYREDNLTIRLDLVGDSVPDGTYRVKAGGLHLLAGKDGIDLDLLEPIADVVLLRAARARLRVHGDLTRWHGRLNSLTGLFNGVRVAGQIELDTRLHYEAEAVLLEDVKLTGHAVHVQGFGLNVDEPSLDFTTSGRWQRERETLELQHTRLSCPTVTLQAPSATLSTDRTGAWQITAGTTVQGDIARLRRCLLTTPPNTSETLAGALAGRIDLRPDEGRQVVQLDLTVQNLAFGPPAAPVWREPRVHLTGQGVYDLMKDSFQVVQLHLESPTLNGDASGQIAALSSDMELSLEGKIGYDLEKLEPQLRPYFGSSVKLAGRDSRPFHIAVALAAPEAKPLEVAIGPSAPTPAQPALLGRLHGDAGLNWQSLGAMGCQIGAAELRGRLADGWFRAAPIEATLNEGRLRLEPSVRLDPGPLEVTLAKGRAIERARLTPAACASAVGYALPVLADVAQADGELSLDLQSGRVPLTDPARGDVAGWLTIHSAQVSAGPLVRELSVLLNGPASLTLAKENVVPFRMVNGRVYHTGLELHFPELTIRTSGSVGLDGSLELVADMPVPPKWLGSGKLAQAVGKQTIRLPIAGTLSKPKLDERALREASAKFARDAAENAIRQEMDGKLKKEAENGLKKLFRRK
ncbi:MAG TPA: DUF748 domain-containing protein [Gemmataceae bacterium]